MGVGSGRSGSGRVGSGQVRLGRVGFGGVRPGWAGSGGVGSDQVELGWVGSGQVRLGWVGTLVEELIDDGILGMDALFVKCGYIWNYNKLAIYNNIVLCISKL